MKYYSTITKKLYDTEHQCFQAEEEHKEQLNQQSKLEKELSEYYTQYKNAYKNLSDGLLKYFNTYKEIPSEYERIFWHLF